MGGLTSQNDLKRAGPVAGVMDKDADAREVSKLTSRVKELDADSAETFFIVVLQKSFPTQICQLILCIRNSKG